MDWILDNIMELLLNFLLANSIVVNIEESP